jgi:hypothetical protein
MTDVAHIKRGLVYGQGNGVVPFGRRYGHRVVHEMLSVKESDEPRTPSCALVRERVRGRGRCWVAYPEIVPENLRGDIYIGLRRLALPVAKAEES